MSRYDLTDFEWRVIEPLLPNKPRGVPRVDEPPAGWVYVASHPLGVNHTKIGYSKWHPTKPCFKYTSGFKRLHHLEFSLRAFGLENSRSGLPNITLMPGGLRTNSARVCVHTGETMWEHLERYSKSPMERQLPW